MAHKKVNNTIVNKRVVSDHLISIGKHGYEMKVLIAVVVNCT